ncbi:MAG: hypothetical protein FWC43_03590 [Planctomycetaceae bacterium]|nr:hypothetical protein [Planctomycetaceae bacterium]
MQRYSPFFALVFVGTLFSLFWGYSAPKESPLGELPNKLKPGDPEYRTFYNNYQSFYGDGKEERRERLRRIQKQLESDPQSQILKKELATYHAWLKTVPEEKKSKIDPAKTIEERLKVIRSVKMEQNRIQGVPDRKKSKSNSRTTNLYPGISELADYLKYLESVDPARLETLLGHTPNEFLYQLKKDYDAETE